MSFAVGQQVLRRSGFGGWESGLITGQVAAADAWYVTTGPGRTYLTDGHDLRPVVTELPIRHRVADTQADRR
jgi:hypothetical protein